MDTARGEADPPSPPALGGGRTVAERRAVLRGLVAGPGVTVVPGVYDALTAVLVGRAGFPVAYLTGAGVANTQLGVPDVGLLQFDSLALQVGRVCAVAEVPLVVDADTGFGGPASVMYVVRTLEALGAAAVQIEDQVMPKRCGHFERKAVVPVGEMQAKVEAAVLARSDPDFLVVARTDALAVEGLESALRRARAYVEAGADVLFVEAPTSLDQLERIGGELGEVPLLLNIVEGGVTPDLGPQRLEQLGFRLALHANVLMRTMARAALDCLAALAGGSLSAPPLLSWDERQELVRLAEFDDLEDRLRARWGAL